MEQPFPNKVEHLNTIFYPQSVAVVGANKVPGTVPYDMLINILHSDFQGVVYPVNPREKAIAGVKAYKYVIDIPDPVDLAVIVYPSTVCHMALEQCGQKGIKSAIIISAGFREIGGVGVEREQQLLEIAKKYDISFIGPNCLGVINTDSAVNLNASFARQMPDSGNIGFLSQSGALCTAVLDYAQARHIGFSKFVSFGNKADVSEIDLLYYLGNDPKTKVILIYLEEISDGRALMRAAEEIIRKTGKPILAIKSGRTEAGASAAASHTGSLAGSDEICDAALRQAGIIRCQNIEEMFNLATAFAYQELPKTNRVAIITNAGGPGVLTTDAAIQEGLELARFSEETTAMFKKTLPKTANIKNPVDVIGDARADRYSIAVSQAMKDPNVDGVFVILTPQSMTDIEAIAREIVNVAGRFEKPLMASFMGEKDVAVGIDILQRNRIPHYTLPEAMARSFAAAYRFYRQLQQEMEEFRPFEDVNNQLAQKILEEAKARQRRHLSEYESAQVLAAYGLPVVESHLAKSAKEAASLAGQIGFPLVMKVMSEQVIHKSDLKAVALNIETEEEAARTFDRLINNVKERLPDAAIDGVLVRKMIPAGEEVILGLKRDVSFDGVIMFGMGGVLVEVLKDITFRIAPVAPSEAQSMIKEIKGAPLLFGVRKRAPKDVPALEESIQRLSQLAVECPQIKELDINPLIVLNEGQGCFIADARIIL
ncbi:acetate--CoA ligase family protein [Caldithrix abyssi]